MARWRGEAVVVRWCPNAPPIPRLRAYLPAPNANLAITSGTRLVAAAVPKSAIVINAMPAIIAGLRAISAKVPALRAPNSSATAGAEMTIPLVDALRPIALPYYEKGEGESG